MSNCLCFFKKLAHILTKNGLMQEVNMYIVQFLSLNMFSIATLEYDFGRSNAAMYMKIKTRHSHDKETTYEHQEPYPR
jgi:hypothetical protein